MRKQAYTLATNFLASAFKTPPYIILFVSDVCRNNCQHCWYTAEWKKEQLSGTKLTLDEYEKISLSIPSIKFLTFAGGEALLREDLEEIVHAFNVNTRLSRYDMPTAGFDPDLISRKVENMLSQNKNVPFRVDVSLDGLEETHNAVRRNKDAFRNAIKTIESLKNIKARDRNFDVAIITTISDYNNTEVDNLAPFIKKILPNGEWMINIVRGQSPGMEISKQTATAYRHANEIIADRIKNKEFIGDRAHALGKLLTAKNAVRRDLISDIIDNRRAGGGCAAGCLEGVIYTDGDVRPCEMLSTSFGNIRDYDYNLPKAWMSKRANQIRKEIQYSECICTHECYLSVSILIQPSCWFRLLGKVI